MKALIIIGLFILAGIGLNYTLPLWNDIKIYYYESKRNTFGLSEADVYMLDDLRAQKILKAVEASGLGYQEFQRQESNKRLSEIRLLEKEEQDKARAVGMTVLQYRQQSAKDAHIQRQAYIIGGGIVVAGLLISLALFFSRRRG